MTQPSKIARLPEALRDELNHRLADNESSRTLLPWLNALPAVRSVLAAEFTSRPISRQNLCKWRAHGFAAWQLRREMLAQSRPTTPSVPFVPSVPSVPSADPTPQWSEHLAQLLAMHYFDAIARWDGHSDAPCRPKFRALRALCREVHQLRHADLARQRLQLQLDLLALQTPVHPPETVQIPSEKSAQTPTKTHIVNSGKPQNFSGRPPRPSPAHQPCLPGTGKRPRRVTYCAGHLGVRRHVAAFPLADMSASSKARTCPRTPCSFRAHTSFYSAFSLPNSCLRAFVRGTHALDAEPGL